MEAALLSLFGRLERAIEGLENENASLREQLQQVMMERAQGNGQGVGVETTQDSPTMTPPARAH